MFTLLALVILSMDFALCTIWVRRVPYKWSKAILIFTASLLGGVFLYALRESSAYTLSYNARRVIGYVFSGILIADSAFMLGVLPFFCSWIIAHPMNLAEKVLPFVNAGFFVGVSVLALVFQDLHFMRMQYLSWVLVVLYCVVLLVRKRHVDDKSVRIMSLTIVFISLAMLPLVLLSMFLEFMINLALPIICSSYCIAMLVFMYIALYRNEKHIEQEVAEAPARPSALEDFPSLQSKWHITEREFEVIKLIKKGLTNKEIASELGISVNTVNNHIANIFAKTEVRSRIDLLNLLQEASW